jgi:hypothetical protein
MSDTRVFRAIHFQNRRREVVSDTDPTPINVQPGEMLYDPEENKLYAGLEDTTAVEVVSASPDNYCVESDITGLTGGTVLTNIVKITQAGYNELETKDPATVYYIVAE